MTDLSELAASAAVCTPEQIAAAYREIRIATAPAIRPAADELRPVPDKPSERVENVATALLVALPIAVLTFGPPLS